MANTTPFNSDDPIFGNISISTEQLEAINASPLMISLLRFFDQKRGSFTPPFELTADQSATSSGYEPGTGINIKQTELNFVRVLGHELTHFYDDVDKQSSTNPDKYKNFTGIINREMDESEATAASFIIRQQILEATNGATDIGISNRINNFPESNTIIAELENEYANQITSSMTIDDFWPLAQQIAEEKIWGRNFHTRPRTDTNRWQDALSDVYDPDHDYDADEYPAFLREVTLKPTVDSATIITENNEKKHKLVFTRTNDTDITWIVENSTGTNEADILVVAADGSRNHLIGAGGNDVLVAGCKDATLSNGSAGAILDGGAGNDILYSGEGQDTLNGGADNDTFIVTGNGTAYSNSRSKPYCSLKTGI